MFWHLFYSYNYENGVNIQKHYPKQQSLIKRANKNEWTKWTKVPKDKEEIKMSERSEEDLSQKIERIEVSRIGKEMKEEKVRHQRIIKNKDQRKQ